jgi:hypothetical protein
VQSLGVLNQHQSTYIISNFFPQAWMDEIHHFYGESNIHPRFPTTKQNQLEVARDSIVRSPHTLKPKIAEIKKIKNNNFFLKSVFFAYSLRY